MAPYEEMQTAMVNRSIRTIKAELEFLADASVLTPAELSELLSRIPAQTALHAPISVGAVPTALPTPGAPPPPTSPLQDLSINEKQNSSYYQPQQQPTPTPAPPPAYGAPPPSLAPPLARATALYAYNGTDPGDLTLQPNDHITVTEYMNAEWWKGRSSRTNEEGIFPRSYVRVIEDLPNTSTNYGNMPLEVSGAGDGSGKVPGKGEEMGKKFGKKVSSFSRSGCIHPLCIYHPARILTDSTSLAMPPYLVLELLSVVTLSTRFSKLDQSSWRMRSMLRRHCIVPFSPSMSSLYQVDLDLCARLSVYSISLLSASAFHLRSSYIIHTRQVKFIGLRRPNYSHKKHTSRVNVRVHLAYDKRVDRDVAAITSTTTSPRNPTLECQSARQA